MKKLASSSEGGDKISDSINYGEILDWLNKQQECQPYHHDLRLISKLLARNETNIPWLARWTNFIAIVRVFSVAETAGEELSSRKTVYLSTSRR
jgi:hypothetical protein